MTTVVVKTIGSTGDYSTPQLWEDASPVSLTAVDQIWEGQEQDQVFTTASGQMCTFGGTTTDATRFKRLRCVPGASFSDKGTPSANARRYNTANGAAHTTSTSYGSGFLFSEANVHLQGLQAEGTTNSSGLVSVSVTPFDLNGCLFETLKSGGISIATGTFRNSLVIPRRGGLNPVIALVGGTVTFVNNTVATPSDLTKSAVIFSNSSTVLNASNSAFFGTTALTSGTTTNNYVTCATDVASPPTGCITATYNTSLFTNITNATRDYRPVAGSALIDAASTDATNAANDIIGTARPQGGFYDIGCEEFMAASAARLPHPLQLNRAVARAANW